MNIIAETLRDRGSRYAASGGAVQDRSGIDAAMAALKSDRKFARATHHSWAVVLTNGGAIKNDDGEAGAGAVILKMLEREGLRDHLVIVTRWYGGVNLGGERFAHVVTSVRAYLGALRDGKW